MALYDEHGNEVTGAMTKEEVEAATKTAAETAIVDAKKVEDDAAAVAAQKKIDDDAAAAAAGGDTTLPRLERLERERLADTYAGTDPEKRTKFLQGYGQLSGFADDDAGIAAHAEAAQRLAFGTVEESIYIPDGTAGTRQIDTAKPAELNTEADKSIQKALGISAADIEKFGPQAGTGIK